MKILLMNALFVLLISFACRDRYLLLASFFCLVAGLTVLSSYEGANAVFLGICLIGLFIEHLFYIAFGPYGEVFTYGAFTGKRLHAYKALIHTAMGYAVGAMIFSAGLSIIYLRYSLSWWVYAGGISLCYLVALVIVRAGLDNNTPNCTS